MTGPGAHLNDEQFTDLMLGLPVSPAATAHLAGCTECRAEMQGFSTAVTDLSAAGLAWSQAHPPARTQAPAVAVRRPLFGAAGWAMAAAAVVGVAVVPMLRHQPQADAPVAVVEPASGGDSEAQIAQDNQLLQEVSLAIQSGDASPDREYGLSRENAHRGAAGAEMRVQ